VPETRKPTNVPNPWQVSFSNRLPGRAGSLGSCQSELLEGPEALRACGRCRQLDYVRCAGIGMHPGTPLVLQIYSVLILKAPKKGKLVIVGSGFRYFADSDSHEEDNFTLVVIGKNRRDEGESVLDVAVRHSLGTVVGELP
jgi:hypothetical protein